MIIGVPKEIKDNEYRVSMTPAGARALTDAGHRVVIEAGAGAGSSIPDDEYRASGAVIASADEVWTKAELIVKVKEPLSGEFRYLKEGLTVFTFLHLAANRALGEELLKTGVEAIGYETVELPNGTLPILAPMSEVAGRLAVQAGAHYLMRPCGGRGVLLSGVPGVERGSVVIIGAGIVGVNAARIALGLGADVTILDKRVERLRELEDVFGSRLKTLYSNAHNIEAAVTGADLLIGAVHVPGLRTPCLVTRAMIPGMKKGAVIVDVSVDQGGCIETIRPTTHSNPTYEVDGVIHYGVANMPGAVPRTSTFALTNATLPYLLSLANKGVAAALAEDAALRKGLNIAQGRVVHPAVKAALGVG